MGNVNMFYHQIPESVSSHFETPDWMRTARFGTWDEVPMTRSKVFERAEMLAENGYNAVVTFGSHFLWDYVEEMDKVKERVELLTQACHEFGIKVIEHKSSVFFSREKSEELRERDIVFRGVSLQSMLLQSLDRYDRNLHHDSLGLCFNNPDYQKLFLKLMLEFAELGIDGYMSDDVQFRCNWFTCVCNHCRKQYQEYSGYELPIEDDSFWGNFDDKRWLRWIDFRLKSVATHHVRLTDTLEKNGFHLARLACCSGTTSSYKAQAPACVYEAFRPGNNVVFQEVNINSIPFLSWESRLPESLTFNAIARRHNSPVLSIYYNYDPEAFRFSWAMAKLTGHRFWTTSRRRTISDTFKKDCEICGNLLNFEKENEDVFTMLENASNTAVFFSARTRDLYKGQENDYYASEWKGWCRTLLSMNIQFDVITEDDHEDFSKYSLIVVPNAAMMYDETVEAIENFVKNGGKLILTHQTSLFYGDGGRRDDFALSRLIGLSYRRTISDANLYISVIDTKLKNECGDVVPNYTSQCETNMLDNDGEMLARIIDCEAVQQHPAVYRKNFGNGEIMYVSAKPGTMNCVCSATKPLKKLEDSNTPYTRTSIPDIHAEKFMQTLVTEFIPNECLFPGKIPHGIHLRLYSDVNRKRFVLHSLNLSTADNNHELTFTKNETIHYPLPEKDLEINLEKLLPFRPDNVKVLIPFSDEIKGLNIDKTALKIPKTLIQKYAVIVFEE